MRHRALILGACAALAVVGVSLRAYQPSVAPQPSSARDIVDVTRPEHREPEGSSRLSALGTPDQSSAVTQERGATSAPITPLPSRTRYQPPSDPRELAKRFFGEEARAIARRWESEQASAGAADIENNILTVYADAQAANAVQDVECRSTLCRIKLDRKLATEDHAAVKRMAGKLGVNGWMLNGDSPEQLLTFVPMDFVSM